MKISRITLSMYKRIERAEIALSDVNVIVGGNNSGKSSILQGIHFSITVAATARQQSQTTFASDLLPYNPTPDFSILRNSGPYLNQSGAGDSKLTVFSRKKNTNETPIETSYSIILYKGRNHGNIGCNREGDYQGIGSDITDPNNLYSIYVPGLAGVAQQEELRAKAIIKRGTASGDANLYLRNIIYYINKSNNLNELNSLIGKTFKGVRVDIDFDDNKDHRIQVYIHSEQGRYPLELAGTGLLQVLQIYSYVIYFSPRLLLLDEPDSHLHPDNQSVLCHAITQIAQAKECQILLCTHSRHVVEELTGIANFIWLKSGVVQEQGTEIERLPLLLDLGALDSFDKLKNGLTKLLILTEDRKKDGLEFLLSCNGFAMNEVLVYSYKTATNLEGALMFVDFLADVAPTCKVMIHRDRDFMTHEEAKKISDRIKSASAIPYITDGSDIESIFISPQHLSEASGIESKEIKNWLDEIARENHNELQHQFTRKRDNIKFTLYKGNLDSYPDTFTMLGAEIPLTEDKRKGKFMMKKILGNFHSKFSTTLDIMKPTSSLTSTRLQEIKNEIWPK